MPTPPLTAFATLDTQAQEIADIPLPTPKTAEQQAEGGTRDITTSDTADYVAWTADNDLDWLDEQAISYDENASLPDIFSEFCSPPLWPTNDTAEHAQGNAPETALAITAPKAPKLLYTPVDLSTMLMEYWFSDVCPMWSAFDSPSNPHRQLAANVWQHSDAVFYALQSMSAACLVDSLPHIKKYVGPLSTQAVEAIQCGVTAHKQLELQTSAKFPQELLLAIIAMGTSVCWTDTRQLGLWFLTKAHELLTHYEDDAVRLDEHGRQELVYFREALVYWEMLYRVVGSDPRDHLKKRKQVYMKRLLHAMSMNESPMGGEDVSSLHPAPAGPVPKASKDITIHPWTGISTDIQHTFGLVVLLCREHRMAARKTDKRTTATLSDALCDIKLATDLARELAGTDLYSDEQSNSSANVSPAGTGDSITPLRHLVDTAEAYRLAALLLLCQTFQDLEMKDLLGDISASTAGLQHDSTASSIQKHASLVLAMKLVETLRRVPAESGTRCIQPILYVCAGSGLKFDAVEGESEITPADARSSVSPASNDRARSTSQSSRTDVALLSSGKRATAASMKTASLTKCTLEVSKGRRFVIDRLCALQRSLPPRPIGVALDLVKAIWTEYDYSGSSEPPHWIDVMVDKGLQTLFG